jgi:transposase-like protein
MQDQANIFGYTEAFKRKVVQSIEKGKFNISKARKFYDIGGKMTVQRWIKKYGNSKIQERLLGIDKENESNKIKQLKQQKQELESALAQAHLKILSYESMLEVLGEEYGADLESIKKKSVTRRSKKRR